MAKYKKKFITEEIEAFQWTGDQNHTEDPIWIIEAVRSGKIIFDIISSNLMIINRDNNFICEGELMWSGDYVIKNKKGEIYGCYKNEFESIYEEIKDDLYSLDYKKEHEILCNKRAEYELKVFKESLNRDICNTSNVIIISKNDTINIQDSNSNTNEKYRVIGSYRKPDGSHCLNCVKID